MLSWVILSGCGLLDLEPSLESQIEEAEELALEGRLTEANDLLARIVHRLEEDPSRFAAFLNTWSDVHFRMGSLDRQEETCWRVLEVLSELDAPTLDDQLEEAAAWNNLGVSFAAQGRPSAALGAYQKSLALRESLPEPPSAVLRHNLAGQLLLLGRVDEGIDALEQATEVLRTEGDPTTLGRMLPTLAWGLALAERRSEAQAVYDEAVALLEAGGAIHDLATTLEQRARFHSTQARRDPSRVDRDRLDLAQADLERALALLPEDDDSLALNRAYLGLGLAAVERERIVADSLASADPSDRLADNAAVLRGVVATFDALGAQDGRVVARVELARTLAARDGPSREGIETLETAQGIVETARADLRLASFRATYLGGWRAVSEELVDLLASASLVARQRGEVSNAEDLASRALEAAERARARALLDLLAAEDRAVAEVAFEERVEVERLEHQAVLDRTREALTSGQRDAGQSVEDRRDAVRRARIALARSKEVRQRELPPTPVASPARVAEIRELLANAALDRGDHRTVLVAVSLGKERSWLWWVEPTGVAVEPLPPGPTLEALARNVHHLLPRQGHRGLGRARGEALAQLSEALLGPVADRLVGKDHPERLPPERLAVVPDGALHLVPWGVLPNPTRTDQAPVLADHAVIHLPSASTLVALRQRSERPPASKLLAVVADPVFEVDDPRVTGSSSPPSAPTPDQTAMLDRLRRLGGPLVRLPATATEAQALADLAVAITGQAPTLYLGFDAQPGLFTGRQLLDTRILHIATHGLVDAEDPALAGLVLSLVDEAGRPRDGLLRVRDLYDLRLNADLVVLSACRTALGEEIRGEGIVGLTGGFFTAGARTLVVSLWDVDDRATAELMERFYRHLLVGGLAPDVALQRAQGEMWDAGVASVDWGAFLVVGDWGVGFEGLRGH